MSTLDAILLGLLQGLTEFLPVSSSAHLVAGQALLGVSTPGSTLEVALHFGTLLAVLLVMWRDIWGLASDGLVGAWLALRGDAQRIGERAPLFRPAMVVLAASLPVLVAGAVFGPAIEKAFDDVALAGALLCVTGGVLLLTRRAPEPSSGEVGIAKGLGIGLVQAIALLPGISRSGSTISVACMLGVERRAAGRFSFLIAVPALAGAACYKLLSAAGAFDGGRDVLIDVGTLAAGALVAAAVGALCLLLLLRMVEKGQLHWFAAYCLPAGALMVFLGVLG